MYPIPLHRDGAQAVTHGGAHGDPPPYTGQPGGGGQLMQKRNRAARSPELSRDPVAQSRDNTQAERGGTHRVIGHVTQASSAERCERSV